MIIDVILDRKEGLPCLVNDSTGKLEYYNAHDFYMYCMEESAVFEGIADEITHAMDEGEEKDVQDALCKYITDNKYNEEICDYVRSVKWLEDDKEPKQKPVKKVDLANVDEDVDMNDDKPEDRVTIKNNETSDYWVATDGNPKHAKTFDNKEDAIACAKDWKECIEVSHFKNGNCDKTILKKDIKEAKAKQSFKFKVWLNDEDLDAGKTEIRTVEANSQKEAEEKLSQDGLVHSFESIKDEKLTLNEDENLEDKINKILYDADGIFASVGKDEDGDTFVIVDDNESEEKLAKALGVEDLSSVVSYGYADEYHWCDNCGKLISTEPDSKHWMPDFFVGDGGIYCGDCVSEEPGKYLETLINNPKVCNTILSDVALEDAGFRHLDDAYENGWYGREDDPSEIMDKILEKYPEAMVIFNLDFQHQFVQKFSVYVDEDTYNKMEGLDESKQLKEDKEEYTEEGLRKLLKSNASIEDCMDYYLNLYEDTDVMSNAVVEDTIEDCRKDGDNEQANRLEKMLNDNPDTLYFDYYNEKPIIDKQWLFDRINESIDKKAKKKKKGIKRNNYKRL